MNEACLQHDGRLYVVTSLFNPRRFASRLRLYHNFKAWLAMQGIMLLTVELAFGHRRHATVCEACPSDPWTIRLQTDQELWHKERALNIGIHRLSQLVPNWRYVAWMDADIKLVRDDWAAETVQRLQHFDIVQMFGQASCLGPDEEVLFTSRSIGKEFHDTGRITWGRDPGVGSVGYNVCSHPGLAWAFRRTTLDAIGGLLDICVNGSGDLHMMACFAGDHSVAMPKGVSQGYIDALKRYSSLCDAHVRGNVGYVPGLALHHWHGKVKDRGYGTRWKLLEKYHFDPVTDLRVDTQDLYRWNDHDPRVLALARESRKSLAARNEDSIDL